MHFLVRLGQLLHLASSRHCSVSAARRLVACRGVRAMSVQAASATASGMASRRAADCRGGATATATPHVAARAGDCQCPRGVATAGGCWTPRGAESGGCCSGCGRWTTTRQTRSRPPRLLEARAEHTC